MGNYWKNKKVLFIGDSITQSKEYPKAIEELLGIQSFYHCKNGAHLLAMVDGEKGLCGTYDDTTDAKGVLRPLAAETVADCDLIVLYGGYNNLLYGGYNSRSCSPGSIGDLYRPDGLGQDTVAGIMQYVINRIYEELKKADNMICRLLIVTVDCSGKNQWINAAGDEEFPLGSGKSYENIAKIQKAIAEKNRLACCDLFHASGINRHTWCCFGAEQNELNPHYTPYLLDEKGNPVSYDYLEYKHGQTYYQVRGGKVVLEQYDGWAPYPYNCDQLHKSHAGYRRIGEVIAGSIIAAYGA